jgi:hypothetical protein
MGHEEGISPLQSRSDTENQRQERSTEEKGAISKKKVKCVHPQVGFMRCNVLSRRENRSHGHGARLST